MFLNCGDDKASLFSSLRVTDIMLRISTRAAPFSVLPPLRFFSATTTSDDCCDAGAGSGGEEDDFDDEELVSYVASILKEQRSRARWSSLRHLCGSSETALTPSQISRVTLRLRGNPRLALSFFRWCEANRPLPLLGGHGLPAYATVIHVLARARLRSAALSVIQSAVIALRNNNDEDDDDDAPLRVLLALVETYRACDSAPLVFDLFVLECLRAKRVDQALEIVRMLRSRGLSPETRTCGELLQVLSKVKGSDAAFEVYRELYAAEGSRSLPKAQIFNALLLSYYREGKLKDKMGHIREEMGRFGCEPNGYTYSILMVGCCDDGMMEEATAIWGEMTAKHIEPDIVAYNTLIGGFCRTGGVERAEELFREMVIDRELEPMGTTYDHLIRGHCWCRNTDAAVLVYNDMCRKGFRPEVDTAEKLIGELCDRHRVKEGVRILRNEIRTVGFHPSRQCYEALIKGLCRDGDIEDALRLQAEMVGKGFEPDAEVYTAFIAAYRERGEVEMVAKLEKEMHV